MSLIISPYRLGLGGGGGPPPIDPPPDPPPGGVTPITLVNPGFESGLTGWSADPAPRAVVSSTWALITDAVAAHGGSKFLRWSGNSTPTAGGIVEGMLYFHDQQVDWLGTDLLSVTIFARVKRASTDGIGVVRARIGVYKYNAAGVHISTTISGAVGLYGYNLDSSWTQISTFSDKEVGTAYAKIYVEAQGPAGATVEFGDLTCNGAVYVP